MSVPTFDFQTLPGRLLLLHHGLPATKDYRQAVAVDSIDEAVEFLTAGWGVASAATHGSLIVWRDDYGLLRGSFSHRREVTGELATTNMQTVQDWLAAWWPQLGHAEGGAA